MKNEQYIMALDQGTTSSRCILFDHQGNRVSTASQEFSQHYPKPGWVEHDPMEIFASQLGVASRAMNQIGIETVRNCSDRHYESKRNYDCLG